MKSVYLYDIGINPFEKLTEVRNPRFATVTVVQQSIADLAQNMPTLIGGFKSELPRAIKWFSLSGLESETKTQRYKRLKWIKAHQDKWDYVDRNTDTDIYSYLQIQNKPPNAKELETYTGPIPSALLLTSEVGPDLSSIWEAFRSSDTHLGTQEIEAILNNLDRVVICRAYESCSYAFVQFIGAVEYVDQILISLCELKVNRIAHKELAAAINEETLEVSHENL